jgi:putative transposase
MPDPRAVDRERQLEALVIGGYVRGFSEVSIRRLLTDAGVGAVSTGTVGRVCGELRDRYRAFLVRSLTDLDVFALHLDATCLSTRPSGASQGILVAWGYTTQGRRVLLDVCSGRRECPDDWLALGHRLVGRGLRPPGLVISDGAPGPASAIEESWPHADRQLCTAARWRELRDTLLSRAGLQQWVKAAYWSSLDTASSAAHAEASLHVLVEHLGRQHPGAALCLAEGLTRLCVHLTYPLHLRRPLRSTNLLRRSLVELCRRAKAIGCLPGETSCVSLCWAVLDLVVVGSPGLRLTDTDRQRIAERRIATRPGMSQGLTA